jgi:hypothetical protein
LSIDPTSGGRSRPGFAPSTRARKFRPARPSADQITLYRDDDRLLRTQNRRICIWSAHVGSAVPGARQIGGSGLASRNRAVTLCDRRVFSSTAANCRDPVQGRFARRFGAARCPGFPLGSGTLAARAMPMRMGTGWAITPRRGIVCLPIA